MVSPLTRLPLGPLCLLMGVLLFARLASMAVSQAVEETQPALAAALDSHNDAAPLRLAKAALESDPPDPKAGRSYALQALSANPLSVPALQLLALAAEEEGRSGEVRALMRQASSITLRNPLNQIWAFTAALQGGEREALWPLIDRVYATSNGFGRMEPYLHLLIADDYGLEALASVLGRNPAWRRPAFAAILRHGRQTDRALALFDRLAQTPSPPGLDEVRPLLAALVAGGRLDEAHSLWRTHVAARAGEGLTPSVNFEAGLLDMPFEWTVRPDPRANVRLSRESRRRVLNVEFFGGRVGARMVGRMLSLSPGAYVLRGSERAIGLATPRGLIWRLACVGQSAALGETPALNAETDWRVMEMRFTVPDGCRYQMLELALAARAPSEQEIEGVASYADFSIERVE